MCAAPKGNKYAIGNKGGRPPVFKNPKQLAKKVDLYFEYIEGESHTEIQKVGRKSIIVTVWDRYPEPATITGLVLYLGFNSRSSLDYFNKQQVFLDIITRARVRVEHEYEKRLALSASQGAMFALKNMGWKDMKSVELGGHDGKPLQVQAISNVDYSKLPDAILKEIVNARRPEIGQ